MTKSEILQQICELDPCAPFALLVNLSRDNLYYHLQLLLAQSEAQAAAAPAERTDRTARPVAASAS
jgi:hypothetical protein